MYTYYQKVESDKHYLYAKEVAEIMRQKYGVVNLSGKPATQMAAAWLDCTEELTPPLYYCTKNGMCRVYRHWRDLLAWVSMLEYDTVHGVVSHGKTYRFIKKHGISIEDRKEEMIKHVRESHSVLSDGQGELSETRGAAADNRDCTDTVSDWVEYR